MNWLVFLACLLLIIQTSFEITDVKRFYFFKFEMLCGIFSKASLILTKLLPSFVWPTIYTPNTMMELESGVYKSHHLIRYLLYTSAHYIPYESIFKILVSLWRLLSANIVHHTWSGTYFKTESETSSQVTRHSRSSWWPRRSVNNINPDVQESLGSVNSRLSNGCSNRIGLFW